MTRRALRPRPFDNKKKLTIIHDAGGLDLTNSTVLSSIANRNTELEKNNDKVVTVAEKNGESLVPVPAYRPVSLYDRYYPDDFVRRDDLNVEYLSTGKAVLPAEEGPIEYALDGADEKWLARTLNTDGQERLGHGNFEKMIWRLELADAMIKQHLLRSSGASIADRKAKSHHFVIQNITKTAAVKLLTKHEGIDIEIIHHVYDYWIRKRQNVKMPLLRTLQPKTTANDRHPDHTFREREKIKRPNTRRRRNVSREENVDDKLSEIKDELGHVCNIFKAMINRESLKAHGINVFIADKKMLFDKLQTQEKNRKSAIHKICKEQKQREHYLKKEDGEYRTKMARFLLKNVFHGHLRKMLPCMRGFEGGDLDGEALLARRLKKAQKRRQKISSFLVYERNWQSWHAKTWMQKMYVMLKKRSACNEITKHQLQEKLWKTWEKFVKKTRDEKLKQTNEGALRKKLMGPKPTKPRKPKVKDGSEVDGPVVKPAGKKVALKRANGVKMTEKSSPSAVEDSRESEKYLSLEVSKETLNWALKQGIIAPAKEKNLSKEITIPKFLVVPQLGFSCLPSRLIEMHTEAEKDSMQSPDHIVHKNEELKSRRQRIMKLMSDMGMTRSEAIAQEAKEAKIKLEKKKRHHHRSILRKTLRKPQCSSRRFEAAASHVCEMLIERARREVESSYVSSMQVDIKKEPQEGEEWMQGSNNRRKMLKSYKKRIYNLKQGMIESKSKKEVSHKAQELHQWLVSFWKLKFCTGQSHNADLKCKDSIFEKTTTGVSKEIKSEPGVATGAGKDQTKKKINLIKRKNHNFTIDLRNEDQQKDIKLRPGCYLKMAPFQDDDHLNKSQIDEFFKDAEILCPSLEHDVTLGRPSEKEEDDSICHTSKGVTINLGASNRLVKRKGGSYSALCKRHRLRQMILNPLLSPEMESLSLPETKLRKLESLQNVGREIPKPPEKLPLFYHAFKLNRSADLASSSKPAPSEPKFLSEVPEKLLNSGVVRIGRGGRVWFDQMNPITMKKFSKKRTMEHEAKFRDLLILHKVLDNDLHKKRWIKKHSEVQKRIRRQTEEEEMKKLALLQESQAEVARREEKFLPHHSIHIHSADPTSADAQKVRREERSEESLLKEAQRVQGMVMEMGLSLPAEKIYNASRTLSYGDRAVRPNVDLGETFKEMDDLMHRSFPEKMAARRLNLEDTCRKRRKLEGAQRVKSEDHGLAVEWMEPNVKTIERKGQLMKGLRNVESSPATMMMSSKGSLVKVKTEIVEMPLNPPST